MSDSYYEPSPPLEIHARSIRRLAAGRLEAALEHHRIRGLVYPGFAVSQAEVSVQLTAFEAQRLAAVLEAAEAPETGGDVRVVPGSRVGA